MAAPAAPIIPSAEEAALFHPLANLFPLMAPADFEQLVADIRVHGLREPIDRWEGQILEGRHRYLACQRAGVAPRYREFIGTPQEALDYVVSKNLHRRHLTVSQWAVIALDIEAELAREAEARMKAGKAPDPGAKVSQGRAADQAAKSVGVSATYVKQLKRVQKDAPELVVAVRAGGMAVQQAVTQARAHQAARAVAGQQTEVVAEVARAVTREKEHLQALVRRCRQVAQSCTGETAQRAPFWRQMERDVTPLQGQLDELLVRMHDIEAKSLREEPVLVPVSAAPVTSEPVSQPVAGEAATATRPVPPSVLHPVQPQTCPVCRRRDGLVEQPWGPDGILLVHPGCGHELEGEARERGTVLKSAPPKQLKRVLVSVKKRHRASAVQ